MRAHVPLIHVFDDRAVVAALTEALTKHLGKRVQIKRMTKRPCQYSTGFTVEEIDVLLADGQSLFLVCKKLRSESALAASHDVRPSFLYEPTREIAVYRDILAGRELGTPIYYGGVADQLNQHFWLFLERVNGEQLRHVGDFSAWQNAARWLAKLRRSVADSPPTYATAPLLDSDPKFYRNWAQRARAFLAEKPDVPSRQRTRFSEIIAGYDVVIERLAKMPHTLVHGEFYPTNILIAQETAGLRVCPIDWELATIGPAAMDLAALTAGRWSDNQRISMLSAYFEELAARGHAVGTFADLTNDVDFCRLHLAMQMLGWNAGWTAPADQAQDWLSLIIDLSTQLQV